MKKIPLWLAILIFLVFALFVVTFAVQNNTPVELILGKWSVTGSMAIMFILSVAIGFSLACLILLPIILQKSVSNLALKAKAIKLDKKLTRISDQQEEEKEKKAEELQQEKIKAKKGKIEEKIKAKAEKTEEKIKAEETPTD